MNDKVLIGITACDNLELLHGYLSHLIIYTDPKKYDLIVAVDGANPQIIDLLVMTGRPYITGPKGGTARNFNRLMLYWNLQPDTHDVMITMDDDAWQREPDWLEIWKRQTQKFGIVAWGHDHTEKVYPNDPEPKFNRQTAGCVIGMRKDVTNLAGYMNPIFYSDGINPSWGYNDIDFLRRLNAGMGNGLLKSDGWEYNTATLNYGIEHATQPCKIHTSRDESHIFNKEKFLKTLDSPIYIPGWRSKKEREMMVHEVQESLTRQYFSFNPSR